MTTRSTVSKLERTKIPESSHSLPIFITCFPPHGYASEIKLQSVGVSIFPVSESSFIDPSILFSLWNTFLLSANIISYLPGSPSRLFIGYLDGLSTWVGNPSPLESNGWQHKMGWRPEDAKWHKDMWSSVVWVCRSLEKFKLSISLKPCNLPLEIGYRRWVFESVNLICCTGHCLYHWF